MSDTTAAAPAEATTAAGGGGGGGNGGGGGGNGEGGGNGGGGSGGATTTTTVKTPAGPAAPASTPGKKSAAGTFDQSYAWIINLIILIMMLMHTVPIIKKFFTFVSVLHIKIIHIMYINVWYRIFKFYPFSEYLYRNLEKRIKKPRFYQNHHHH